MAPKSLETLTLQQAYSAWGGNEPVDIPFLIWLLENPDSPFALPGKISLRNHDYLHILLNRSMSLTDEAFVIGFTMGNDIRTNWFHITIFKVFARWLYPASYRFSGANLEVFDQGFEYGRSINTKQLNEFKFEQVKNQTIATLRAQLGIGEHPSPVVPKEKLPHDPADFDSIEKRSLFRTQHNQPHILINFLRLRKQAHP